MSGVAKLLQNVAKNFFLKKVPKKNGKYNAESKWVNRKELHNPLLINDIIKSDNPFFSFF